MTSKQNKTVVFAVIVFLAAGMVILDSFTPLGVADWVWYFIPLLLSIYVGGRFFPYAFAAVLSLLTMAGFFLSPPGIDPHLAFMSRLMVVGVQWLMAFLISQRKSMESELFKSRQMLRLVLDTIPQRVFWKDRNLKYLGCNRHFALDGGYDDPNELVGKSDFEASWKEMADVYRADDQQVLDTGKPKLNFDEPQVRSDGARLWLTTSKSPLLDQDGRVIGVLGTYEDNTERKQAERQLAEALDFNQKIISGATVGILVYKASGQCVLANEAAARTLNATVAQLLEQNFRQIKSWRVSDMLKMADETLATKSPKRGEFHLTSTFGKEAWLDCHLNFFVRGNEPHLLLLFNDITERKQAEETLARERSLLRTLIDNLPDCIYAKDTDGRKILANPADLKNLRCKTEAEAISKTDFDFFPKDIAEQFWADDQKVIQGQPVINREEYFLNDEGAKRWLLTSKLPLRDQNGKITGLVGMGRDITERKRVEEALRESQALYHSLVEQMPTGIFRKDRTGRYVFVNSWFCRLRGLNADQIVGRTPDELVPLEAAVRGPAQPEILQLLRDGSKHHEEIVRTGKPIHVNEAYPTAEGGKRHLHVVKSAVFGPDGQIVGTQGIQFDITDLKLAEEHISEQAALLDKAQDAILVLDLDDRIVYWNKSAERIYGWSAVEAIGNPPLKLFLGGVISPRHVEVMKTVNERGEWSGELQEITRNGEPVTVQGRYNLIRDEQGRPKARLIINTDITEKKKLEAQFLRAQRMESLGTLAGGIAHDLNNVLTPLLVAVQVLKEKITDADGQRLLVSLETNVKRGASLVKQVLAFGRGVTGERITVNPKHIVREIKQIVNETFPKSVQFELHCAADLWTITGDPTQLHQVLLNLCVNARDAMPKGGKLSLHLENVTLDEAYASMNLEAHPGPHLCITVDDTGTGIPKEIQEKIFDPFFTTKEPGKGTGLGLSTTLAIVKSHGGFIHCNSTPGKGSTFKVYLPANTTQADAENVVAGETRLLRGHNEVVLVVDDEEPIRKLAQRALERYGYRVLLAADGVEAVSLYKFHRNEIDVVITDMVMPNMDGLATIKALKSINPEIKIVGSSGLASDGGVTKAMNAGIKHFVPKPYTAETMLDALHEVLNGKH